MLKREEAKEDEQFKVELEEKKEKIKRNKFHSPDKYLIMW